MARQAVSLLESLCVSYAEIKPLLSLAALQDLWKDVVKLLTPNTDGAYLAVFLPCALEKQNETCRAESCRCLGWLCSVFPAVRARKACKA